MDNLNRRLATGLDSFSQLIISAGASGASGALVAFGGASITPLG